MITLGKALGDAGRDAAARYVTEQASQLNSARADVATLIADGSRVPAVANRLADVEAGVVIQVGVLHGGLTNNSEPRRPAAGLHVSATTEKILSTTYYYDGGGGHPDRVVHVHVEAFTAQAVSLRQLRPVVVRRISQFSRSDAMMTHRREFRVGLDMPHSSFAAGLDGPGLDLDAAYAAGTDDFPFHVTNSNPEYFVITPEPRRTKDLIEWRLELDWSCLTEHGTVTIDHGGRSFLSAAFCAPGRRNAARTREQSQAR